MAEKRSVANFAGRWVDPDFDSGLIARCKHYWSTPIDELPDLMLATYLSQRFACEAIQTEAQRRLDLGLSDDTELFVGQLRECLDKSKQ